MPASRSRPPAQRSTFGAYAALLREEPKIRAYVLATLADALGIAASIWAAQLVMARVFVDQGTRASLVIPTLVSSLAGTLLAGPLADWHASRGDMRALARWRWRIVITARIVETLALLTLLPALATGTPTVQGLLPYFVVSSFLKMLLGSTRVALEVDLLQVEEEQVDAAGRPIADERGLPLTYKPHLLTLSSMLSGVSGLAALGGLVLGNRILGLAGGRYWPLFAFDIFTNVIFITVLYFACHPDDRRGHVRDLIVNSIAPVAQRRWSTKLVDSFVEVFRFLRDDKQRVLLWVMTAAWLIELFGEFYDDKMIVKQLLGGTDEELWRSEVVWSASGLLPALVLPALSRRVAKLGKLLVVTLIIDGVIIAIAGQFATAAVMLIPFTVALALDRGLTVSSKTLIALIQNSASSAAMRGRLAATFGIVVLLSNILVQSVATVIAKRVGIPTMMTLVGIAMVLFVASVAFFGGPRLWRFGLRSHGASDGDANANEQRGEGDQKPEEKRAEDGGEA